MRRILTVILASDVAGYSRLTAEDEEDTVQRFHEASKLFMQVVAKYQGTVFNTAGDAILARFDSAVDATRCALDIQDANNANNATFRDEKKLLFRIGIAIGDVLVSDDGDLLGDAVNVAARLENLAEAGGICISDEVRAHVLNKIRVSVVDLGDQSLRNISRAVRVYRLVPGAQPSPDQAGAPFPPSAQAPRPARVPSNRMAWFAAAAAVLVALIAGGLSLNFWMATRSPAVPADKGWSAWEDREGYQREFDKQVDRRWYPRMLEAQLFGDVVKYRAYFEPYPSVTFVFYSRHSLDDETFRAADEQYLRGKYTRTYQQRIVVGTRAYNQGTWIKN